MAGFTRSIVIAHPVDKVFDFATDLANAPLFLPSVTKAELITEGGLRQGAKFRETRLMNGKERTTVIEVTEHQRPTVHAASAAMMGMQATYTFRFAPADGGTRVNMDAVVTGNILWKLFLGMMSRMMEKEDGDYLVRLKTAMEKGAVKQTG
jgi:ribosome-associated toxin RatA of RatAB toxin-antitoxin module